MKAQKSAARTFSTEPGAIVAAASQSRAEHGPGRVGLKARTDLRTYVRTRKFHKIPSK